MRNEMTLNALVNELQRNCGDILGACKSVGVSLIFVNQWRKDDKDVNETLTEAERVGVQGLVSEAIRRATGYQEDVFYKGVRSTDTKTAYSDTLLVKLMEAKLPEFSKKTDGPGVNVQVNVANIMPRAANYAEWLTMKDQTVNRLPALSDDREASLEALSNIMCKPGDVIEAEYEQVPYGGIQL